MPERSDPPPQPLQMDRPDVRRVADFLAQDNGEHLDHQRLLIEILEALRAIDDKLGRLLAAGRAGPK